LLLLRVIGWIVEAEDVTHLSRRTMLGPAYVVDAASVRGHSEAAALGNPEVPSDGAALLFVGAIVSLLTVRKPSQPEPQLRAQSAIAA
jgi:hypothetical protein